MKIQVVAEEKYRPTYANETDACMDLRAKVTKEDGVEHAPNLYCLSIPAGETVKIRSGVQVSIPEGYVMKVYVRSSTGIKKNLCLANGTGIIDSGYRDEVIMALHNFGKESVLIKDGDRLCQFIILPFPKLELSFVEDNDDFRKGDRGGGIGSTGEK